MSLRILARLSCVVLFVSCLLLNAESNASIQVTDVLANGSIAATAALGPFAGNDNSLTSNPALLNSSPYFSTAPLSSIVWTLAGKSDDSNNGPFTSNPAATSGTLTFDTPIAVGQAFVISLKAGNSFALYGFTGLSAAVTHVTFNYDSLLNGGGRNANLSHASLFLGPTPTDPGPGVVPEPATIVVWSLLSMVGLTVAYRKRSA